MPLATEPETPNVASGFGRVNLERSIVPSARPEVTNASGFLEGRPLKQGETADINIIMVMIPPNLVSSTFKITLVWTDHPDKLLVNDLDILVKSAGKERHGNVKAGSSEFDRVNNVEQVIRKNPSAGSSEITIHAYNIHQLLGSKTQDYSLVWKLFA